MTRPQRKKLVMSGVFVSLIGLVLYLALFGVQALDPKGLVLMGSFFALAIKLSTVRHKHNPMF